MKFIYTISISCMLMLLLPFQGKANNISVTNVSLVGQNVSAGVNNAANFTYIKFDLTWDNSWRTLASPANWDAAWIFVKYRVVGTTTWNHVQLAPSGHNSSPTTPTTSYSVQVGLVNEGAAYNASTNPAVGAFIYRSSNGTGTFSAQDIRLKWNYRDNGVGDNDIIDIDVYAIEMVNVPQGSFSLGNNGTVAAYEFSMLTSTGRSSYQVGSENGFSVKTTGTAVVGDFIDDRGAVTLTADYPKGFGQFYVMKYECSQQLYVDFLNSLTTSQQSSRLPGGNTGRINISGSAGVYTTTTPFVPMGYVDPVDMMAFLDWSGLRPMSEMEYEKACRGTSSAVTDEYAWGTTNFTNSAAYTATGTATEANTTSGANTLLGAWSPNVFGPLRCGTFATAASSRITSGSSFYGIMDLTGNMWEQVVMMQGAFSGKIHGNGSITSTGLADISNWPGFSAPANSTWTGYTIRGGSYDNNYFSSQNLSGRITNRTFGPLQGSGYSKSIHFPSLGIRGAHAGPTAAAETK